MILYKKDNFITYDDGVNVFSDNNSEIAINDVGNNIALINIYRNIGHDYQNIFTRRFPASEITDIFGNAYGDTVQDVLFGFNKGTDINDIDSETDVVIALFNQRTHSTTLAADAVIDTQTIEVTDTTGIVDGKYLFIFDGVNLRFSDFFVIGTPVGNTVTVDRIIDFAYLSGSNVDAADTNLNVDGSTTPIVFGLRGVGSPQGVELTFSLRRLIFVCETDSAVDLNKFGDIVGGITNGLLFRTRDNGRRKNIFNIRTNGGLASLCYDFTVLQASNPSQGTDGFIARLTFSGKDKMGSIIPLPLGSDAELIVQDALQSLTSLRAVAEGNIQRREK